MVNFASMIFSPNDAAGRTGIGAVMGSKELKTIVVRAAKAKKTGGLKTNSEIEILIKDRLEAIKNFNDPNFEKYEKYEDTKYVKWLNNIKASSIRNFRGVIFDKIETADELY